MRRQTLGTLVLIMFIFFSRNSFADYKIGNITCTTGPYAAMGVLATEGVNLLVEKVNKAGGIRGEKIEILTEDHEGDASKAMTIAKKMIYNDKVIAIIGPQTTAAVAVVSRICNEAKIPQISVAPRPVNEPVSKFGFQTSPETALNAEAVAHFAVDSLGLKKLAIFHDTNSYGTQGAEAQVKAFEKMKIKVVAVEKYMQADRDVTATLIKIRNAGADGLIVWGTVNVPAVVAKDMKKLSMKIPYIGSSGIMSPKFIELAEDAANGVYATSPLNLGAPLPGEQELYNLTRAKYGRDPEYFTAQGYDAALLFVKAFETAKSKDPEKIRDALEAIQGFVGALGTYNMTPTNHTGLSYKDIKIVRVINGKPLALKQPGEKEGPKVSR